MNFSILSDRHKKWQDILVIGKTTERNCRKYHIIDMKEEAAAIYIAANSVLAMKGCRHRAAWAAPWNTP